MRIFTGLVLTVHLGSGGGLLVEESRAEGGRNSSDAGSQGESQSVSQHFSVILWRLNKNLKKASDFDFDHVVSVAAGADISIYLNVEFNDRGETSISTVANLLERRLGERFCRGWMKSSSGKRSRFGFIWRQSAIGFLDPAGEVRETCSQRPMVFISEAADVGRATFYLKSNHKLFTIDPVDLAHGSRVMANGMPIAIHGFAEMPFAMIFAGDLGLSARAGGKGLKRVKGPPRMAKIKANAPVASKSNPPAATNVSSIVLSNAAGDVGAGGATGAGGPVGAWGFRQAIDFPSVAKGSRAKNGHLDNFWFRNLSLASADFVDFTQIFPGISNKEIKALCGDSYPIWAEFSFSETEAREVGVQLISRANAAKAERARKAGAAEELESDGLDMVATDSSGKSGRGPASLGAAGKAEKPVPPTVYPAAEKPASLAVDSRAERESLESETDLAEPAHGKIPGAKKKKKKRSSSAPQKGQAPPI